MSIKRYRRIIEGIKRERIDCEVCHSPASHVHHIIPVSETGIASELVYEPANMMLLCDDCHALQHPGSKNRNMVLKWKTLRKDRGQAIHRS